MKQFFSNLFGLNSRKKEYCVPEIELTETNTGSHGAHWCTIFDEEVNKMDRVIKAIETGKQLAINNSLTIITDPLIRGIICHDTVITGFPYLRGSNYEQFESVSILEWSHVQHLEAIIKVAHVSGCVISFFATDYALHKNIYKTQKNLTLNVVGLVYHLFEFNAGELEPGPNGLTFDEDFCGYLPAGIDEIQFMGRIQQMQEYSLGEIAGYLIVVGITPEFSMEFFIAHSNLSITLEKGKSIRGIAWIQGTLEANDI